MNNCCQMICFSLFCALWKHVWDALFVHVKKATHWTKKYLQIVIKCKKFNNYIIIIIYYSCTCISSDLLIFRNLLFMCCLCFCEQYETILERCSVTSVLKVWEIILKLLFFCQMEIHHKTPRWLADSCWVPLQFCRAYRHEVKTLIRLETCSTWWKETRNKIP